MTMTHSGKADLALMRGSIPPWLFQRMKQLALPIVEAIILQQGKAAFLAKLSNPFWFQSFSTVIGMDWNSSGATTAVMSALKQTLNPISKELGLYVCGGKGKESLKTPRELLNIGDKTGLDGHQLVRASKLTAKVDSTAIQDGFNVYLHNFVVSNEGQWSVIQQGMHVKNRKARRYHWHSENVRSFTEQPHTAICGINKGSIINLVDKKAQGTQKGIMEITGEHPDKVLKEIPHLLTSSYSRIKPKDVDIKRLGSILWLAQETQTSGFEDLLLLKGLGPRTLQSLTLVSEVIHGTPSRFNDPARFAFAHGAKGGNPFPVPTSVYDETITALTAAVEKAKIQHTDKLRAIEKLSKLAQLAEKNFEATSSLDDLIKKENEDSYKFGGRTKKGWVKPKNTQLNLFDTESTHNDVEM